MAGPDRQEEAHRRPPVAAAPLVGAADRGPQGERLQMVRSDLEGVPAFPLPEGIGLRRFCVGDQATWASLVAAADPRGTPRSHQEAFGEDTCRLVDRQWFLTAPSSEVVGTATAWFGSGERGAEWGRVHWVAILPDWQGQGLAKPLLSATLQRLRELGHARAYLITEPVRHAALRLYLRFGFRPDIQSAADLAAWQKVERAGIPVDIRVCAERVFG